MKILSDEQYGDLVKTCNRIESMENQRDHAIDEAADLRKKNTDAEEDRAILEARKDAELDVKIYHASKKDREKIQDLTIANNKLQSENDILKKAFENLGFDVKDMKEILNKLVDGIVSKNTVQLVK